MRVRRYFPVLVVLMGVLGTAPDASAEGPPGPGWELTARTYPTNLVVPINEVQEVAVKAEGGTFTLSYGEVTSNAIPFLAPRATVQSELESLSTIGKGGVSVTEGPEGGVNHPYRVEFIGALGNMKAPELEADGTGLSGTAPTATVTVNTLGAASGTIAIDVFNVGAAASKGTITVTDTLPPGVKAKEAGELIEAGDGFGAHFGVDPTIGQKLWDCAGNGTGSSPRVAGATVVTCTNDPKGLPVFYGGGGLPAGPNATRPNTQPPIAISVEAGAEATGLTNHVTIAGGAAPVPASTHDLVTIGSKPAVGLVGWDAWFSNADGTLDTQAGSHPYEATFSFDLATALDSHKESYLPDGEPRDIEVQLPPGLIGNPLAVAQCTRAQLHENACPQASQVGIVEVNSTAVDIGIRVYNLVPPPGVPAEFGFNLETILVLLDSTVRTGGNYGITTHIDNVPQKGTIQSILTLWNVPGEPSHNLWRNGNLGGCTPEAIEHSKTETEPNPCTEPQYPSRKPFLTLPTSCGEPQPLLIRVLSGWQDPAAKSELSIPSHNSNDEPTGATGCEDLAFGPTIATSPDTARADTPAGLTFEVNPPVGGLEESGLLGTSDIKDTVVTLPPGFVINPGQAAGLEACQPSQDGLTTPAEQARGEENDRPPSCPNASKVGTITAKSPLIEGAEQKEFKGNIYVMQSNPPHLKLLVAPSADGVYIKQVLNVELDEATGQLTTKVSNFPEDPVSNVTLSFSGGPQAALDTPPQCGTYQTTSDFTPWSSPFIADAFPTASFSITEGPGGGACPSSPMPFSPSMVAGSTTDQAGAFTNFSLLLQRGDGQQRIEKLQFKEPAGLAGLISSVPLCDEANANAGTCSAASHIGHAVVTSGPGPYPLVLPQPGAPELPIFLTGPYKGAPFGLSIVTPIIAGPFNLGTIITRAKIEIDPRTAQITITTDALPQIVDGVPTDLRSINSIIDRPNFLFNPTNCTPAEFTGTAWGTPPPGAAGPGTTAAISSHFGIGSCRELAFTPKFQVSTSGKSSKAQGASLTVKLSYPAGSQGTEANIARVKVELPKQLPSQLKTLQKACLAAVFEANPAGCPAESIVGHATVHTPLLPVPLTGPAYFVSHGGEEFPDLTLVLQGYGVTVELVGSTFISKAGITSSTFKATPDVPFNIFELTLPQGKYAALTTYNHGAAGGSLCGQSLTMPTEFRAQNGAEIHQSTPITVTGCPAAITVVRQRVKGKTATIQVRVPGAGKLVATAKGLSKASKTAKGATTLTLKLTLTNAEAVFLGKHKARKLKAKVNLQFTPKKGGKLKTSTTVILG
jgi:hypothetical protein